jgi:hypothetical protein
MHTPPRVAGVVTILAAWLAFAGCQKKDTATGPGTGGTAKGGGAAAVQLVGEAERSRNFAAVNRQLELGGTVYAYVDIDGDVLELTRRLQGFLQEAAKTQPNAAMVAQQDLPAIVTMLGLTDIKALGASSVPEADGFFRNRMFVYTGAARRGLLAGLGGKPGPFKHLALAPADAAFYGESEFDAAAIYRTLKEVIGKVAGEQAGNQIEATLKKAGEAATISFLDLIYGLKGRSAVVLRIDPEKTFRAPGAQPVVLPMFSLVACVEGVGQIVEPSLAKTRELRRTEQGAARIYQPVQRLPVEGLEPAIVIEGSTLFVTTSLSFLKECRERKTGGLAETPEFQQSLARVGKEGNGLTYVSPQLFAQVRRLETLNPNMPPQARSTLNFILAQMPASERPLVAVRTNLEDGILIRSHLNRSVKQDIAAVALYNPVTVGLVAAMAIPAFQKVRMASQEKAVLNNLRQLAAAADQHYLETGTRTATYDQLVGPTRYIKTLQPVVGENYRALRFRQGETLRVQLPDGRMVEYAP